MNAKGLHEEQGRIIEGNPLIDGDHPVGGELWKSEVADLEEEEEEEFVVVEAHDKNESTDGSQAPPVDDKLDAYETKEPGVASSLSSSGLENENRDDEGIKKVDSPVGSSSAKGAIVTVSDFENSARSAHEPVANISRKLSQESQKCSMKDIDRSASSSSISVNTMDSDDDDLDGASSVDDTLDDNVSGPDPKDGSVEETTAERNVSSFGKGENLVSLERDPERERNNGTSNHPSSDLIQNSVESHHGGIFPDELRDSAIRTLVDSQSLLSSHCGQGTHDHDGMSSLSSATAKGEKIINNMIGSLASEASPTSHTKGLLIVPPAVDDCESHISSCGTNDQELSKEKIELVSSEKEENAVILHEDSTALPTAMQQNQATERHHPNSELDQMYEEYINHVKRNILMAKVLAFFTKLLQVVQAFGQDCILVAKDCYSELLQLVIAETEKLLFLKEWVDDQLSNVSSAILSIWTNFTFFREVLLAPPSDLWVFIPTTGQMLSFGCILGMFLLVLVTVVSCRSFFMYVPDSVNDHHEDTSNRHHRLVGFLEDNVFSVGNYGDGDCFDDTHHVKAEEATVSSFFDSASDMQKLKQDENKLERRRRRRRKTTSLVVVNSVLSDRMSIGENNVKEDSDEGYALPQGDLKDAAKEGKGGIENFAEESADFSVLSWELGLHQLMHSGSCDVSLWSGEVFSSPNYVFHNCTVRGGSLWNSPKISESLLRLTPLERMYSHYSGNESEHQDMHTVDVEEMVEAYSLIPHEEDEDNGAFEDAFGLANGRLQDLVQETLRSLSMPDAASTASAVATAAMKRTAKGARWLWSDLFQKQEDESSLASDFLYKTMALGLRAIPSITGELSIGASLVPSQKSNAKEEKVEDRAEIEGENAREEAPLDDPEVEYEAMKWEQEDVFSSDRENMNDVFESVDQIESVMSLVSIQAQNLNIPSMASLTKWAVKMAEGYYQKLGDVVTNLQHLMIREIQQLVRALLGFAHALGYEMEVDHVLNGLNFIWSHVKKSAHSRSAVHSDASVTPVNSNDEEWIDKDSDLAQPSANEEEDDEDLDDLCCDDESWI